MGDSITLSVVDQSPMRKGGSAADALSETVALAQVAERLNLSLSTVCGMLRRGEIPAVVVREGRGPQRVRRIHRVSESDLEAWIFANRTRKSLKGKIT